MVKFSAWTARFVILVILLQDISSSPALPNFDIWSDITTPKQNLIRLARMLNFFPLPVEEECLSKDGRRAGLCLNTYECRIQGGTARGSCALGFGVCCVFTATCGGEVANNITYIVSPGFPGLHTDPPATCEIIIKQPAEEIAQLRFDFVHFNIGQPNRSTGVCDGDLFTISGGATPDFRLCGQNNGQHVYFELLPSKSRAENGDVRLSFSSMARSFPRIWEIRMIQVAPEQRAPNGCLQLYTGVNGTIQTMNYAANGRHLADQNYRACVRQEQGMCSIAYEPCHEGSFRIGQPQTTMGQMSQAGQPGSGSADGMQTAGSSEADMPGADEMQGEEEAAADDQGTEDEPEEDAAEEADEPADEANEESAAEDDEGSGGGGFASFFRFPSFSFPSFFRSARQFIPIQCTDRITMPCVVEDFLSAEGGQPSPLCEPVHCGLSLCNAAMSPCRLESSVTPFGIGVHFGPGEPGKGSPEDNIGACLRYTQVPCAA
ncbi:uncharacterized protein LOC113377363 isoform X2 [Ctenocephalides felis]|uniref:uncharacterized protein LOC113377363 isoform X2 n=1 Tax=Ctenocephalides felis TaxID=7515 RepID=UPI000E6E3E1E|nr:uncharacterized protein LOC113377363 isoform X2 [Ctenocephalides felis]